VEEVHPEAEQPIKMDGEVNEQTRLGDNYEFEVILDLSTCVSCGCPAENGTHGIPFSGCNKKLNGLLSTITIRHGSFDMQERSFTCSRYSLYSVHIQHEWFDKLKK
jgi:hypothetical protein